MQVTARSKGLRGSAASVERSVDAAEGMPKIERHWQRHKDGGKAPGQERDRIHAQLRQACGRRRHALVQRNAQRLQRSSVTASRVRRQRGSAGSM